VMALSLSGLIVACDMRKVINALELEFQTAGIVGADLTLV